MLVTDADLSDLAGISARRIRQLVEAGRLTRVERNRYQLAEVFSALVEEMSGGDKASELTAARVRKLNADADMSELELAKAKSLVAPIEDMVRVWSAQCALIRANMLSLPSRVVTQLIGEDDQRRFRQVLTEEIKTVLTDAANANIEIEEDND